MGSTSWPFSLAFVMSNVASVMTHEIKTEASARCSPFEKRVVSVDMQGVGQSECYLDIFYSGKFMD